MNNEYDHDGYQSQFNPELKVHNSVILGHKDSAEIIFNADGIYINGVKKDVDSDWPEIYERFKAFVRDATPINEEKK